MELWQMELGIAFFLAVLTFAYLLISWMRRERRDKKAEIIMIIKEINFDNRCIFSFRGCIGSP
jgi:hypothetical protein